MRFIKLMRKRTVYIMTHVSILSIVFFFYPPILCFMILSFLFPLCLKSFIGQSIKVGLLAIKLFSVSTTENFFMSHSFLKGSFIRNRILSLTNSFSFFHLKKYFATFFWTPRFQMRIPQAFEMVLLLGNTLFLFSAFKVFPLSFFGFQKFSYCCWFVFILYGFA